MKKDVKRFGNSAIAIVLSAVMLLSTMVIAPGTVTWNTANALTVEENSVAQTAETVSEKEENTVTVDIEPEDIQSSVLDADVIKQAEPEAEESAVEEPEAEAPAAEKNIKVAAPAKVLPKASGATSRFYFANVFKGDDDGKWNPAYAHYWKGNSINDVALDNNHYDSDKGLYYIDIDTSTYENLIFHGGSSNNLWIGKSKDLTLSGHEGMVYVPATNTKTNAGDVGFDGWWITTDEYSASVSSDKTVYYEDNVGWNADKIYAYVWSENNPGDHIEMSKNDDGYYYATIDSSYQKVIFKRYNNSNSNSWNANDVTTGYSLIGHDGLLLFSSCKGNQYFNSTGKRYGTWVNANSHPDESKLISGTKSEVNGWKMFIANSDSSFSAGSENYYIACENDVNNKSVPVYQIQDNDGTTWYYSEVTAAQAKSQMWFVLSVYGTDSSNHSHWWYKNGGSSVSVTTSNSVVAPVQKREKDQHYMGLVETKKTVESVKVYFNSLESFNKYTVVPISRTAPAGSINVIAKDGTIRDAFKKFASLADTKIIKIGSDTRSESTIGSVTVNNDCLYRNEVLGESAFVPLGSTIQIETTINEGTDENEETLRKKYYVKAFNINGETVIADQNGWVNTGVYTCSYKLPSSTTASQIEITPVYFYNEDTTENSTRKYITFIAENYVGDVVTQWGKKADGTDGTSILAGYSWYGEKQDEKDAGAIDKPALGGYPGQPMVYENGHYIMTVPTTNDAGNSIQGVTLNNYVWDFIHCDAQDAYDNTARKKINAQTYDYDDFVVLANADPLPEFIVFRFKYETTKKANLGSSVVAKNADFGNQPAASDYSGETNLTNFIAKYDDGSGNGWEDYDDYYGNTIDLFNYVLKRKGETTGTTEYEANKSDPFYVVSKGYQEIYYGHFTTLWYVYDSTGKYVGKIPSSAFYYSGDMTNTNYNNIPSWFMAKATKSNTTISRLTTQKLEYWHTYYSLYKGSDDAAISALNHPVKITYESAIRGEDENANSHPEDPGLRSDGNWYYSKSGETFNAEIVIKYSTLADPTNFSGTDTFVTTDGAEKPYAGSTTGAHAYFTTKSYLPTGYSTPIAANFYQNYQATNVYSSKDNFTVAANQTSISPDGKTTYAFKGWFIEYDGVESPLDYKEDADKVIASAADMRGYVKLVAKYAPVATNTNTNFLTITHDLYANATKFANSPAVLGGDATPSISVQVIDTTNGNAVATDLKVYELNDKTVKIYESELSKYRDSKYSLKVVLNVASDDKTNYNTTYLKTVPESTLEGAAGVNGYSAYSSTAVSGPGDAGLWTGTKTTTKTSSAAGTDTVTYTATVASLFNNTTLKSNVIKFYSQVNSSRITVEFKYYDRDMSTATQSKATNISTEATSFTKIENIVDATEVENPKQAQLDTTIQNAINYVNEKKLVENVIDEYVFYKSQETAEGALKLLKIPGTDTLYTATKYHTDYYSRQSNNNNYFKEDPNAKKDEKWVTYYDADSNEVEKTTGNSDFTDEQFNRICKVVVWAYNKPQVYTMNFQAFGDLTVSEQVSGLYLAQNATNGNDSSAADYVNYGAMQFYYNERVGVLSDNDLIDGVSPHLAEYNINQRPNAIKVQAPDVDGYVFDGWYENINGKLVKVSSDQTYGNRVTKSAILTAGYKLAESAPENEIKGVTVTKNEPESYIDSKGVHRVRYVTQLNAYGCDDSDQNFTSVSVVYIKLPADMDASTGSILVSNLFNDADFKAGIIGELNKNRATDSKRSTTTALVVDIDSTTAVNDRTTVVYTYDIRPTYTDGTENPDPTGNQIVFTNKNRGQFVLDLTQALVEAGKPSSNMMVITPVKYADVNVTMTNLTTAYKAANDDENPTEEQLAAFLADYLSSHYSNAFAADTDNGFVYIVSDNYVVYDNNDRTPAAGGEG